MKGRFLFIAGIAVGYVLGARAGRGSYETIKTRAQGAWRDPRVQQGLHEAGDFVKENAPVAAAKVKDAAGSAVSAVQSKAADKKDGASDLGDKVASTASDVKDQISSASDDVAAKAAQVHEAATSSDDEH